MEKVENLDGFGKEKRRHQPEPGSPIAEKHDLVRLLLHRAAIAAIELLLKSVHPFEGGNLLAMAHRRARQGQMPIV